MLKAASGAALSILLLAACGSRDPAAGPNEAVDAGTNILETSAPSDPAQPGAANGTAEPVPPPDAVSHPDGFLPPAPGEPDPAAANSSGPGAPPPATEDEYMRNRQ
jgi:hypothetical protein